MPSAGFRPYGRFRAMRGAVRVSGLRAGCSPVGAAPGWRRRREGSQFLLANQNLQHLVLKCLLSTKHSRVGNAWQALFDAQERGRKTTTKTAHCGAVCRIFTHVPPHIHRLVHRTPSRRTVARTLQFCDTRFAPEFASRRCRPQRLARAWPPRKLDGDSRRDGRLDAATHAEIFRQPSLPLQRSAVSRALRRGRARGISRRRIRLRVRRAERGNRRPARGARASRAC